MNLNPIKPDTPLNPKPIGRKEAAKLVKTYQLVCPGFGIVADPKNPVCSSECGLLMSHCLNVKRFTLKSREAGIQEQYHKGNWFLDQTWVGVMQTFDFEEFDNAWIEAIRTHEAKKDLLTSARILSGINRYWLNDLSTHDPEIPNLLLERIINNPKIAVIATKKVDGVKVNYYGIAK